MKILLPELRIRSFMNSIKWTEPAVSDLQAIHSFISRDSEYYANAMVSEIIEAVDRLGSFPLSGRMVPELNDEKIREVLVGNYRVIYEISESAVQILTVLHGARDFHEPH